MFDLYQDMLHNVLKHVDMVTLGQAECVNKLWRKVARDERLWGPITTRIYARFGSIYKFIFQFCMKKIRCLPKKKKVRSSLAWSSRLSQSPYHPVVTPGILSRMFLFHFEKISDHFGLFQDVSVNTDRNSRFGKKKCS